MQHSLFIVFLLLSCGNAARVNRRSQIKSSSQTSCRVLAKWICKPGTFEANLGQVEECCRADDVGNEDLRRACCTFAGLDPDGVTPLGKESVAESKKPVAKTPVENPSQVVDVDDGITAELIQEEPLETALSPTLEATLAPIWLDMEITPDPEKQLVQAFHAATRKDGLNWEMSCIDKCVDACELKGGECQAIQSEADCEQAAEELGKPMIPLATKSDQDRFAKGCLVLKNRPNHVRWNPPSDLKPTIKTNNVCGCYTYK